MPVYFVLSEKNASSAVTRLRRSDFIAVTYALPFVFANFGIAIAAKNADDHDDNQQLDQRKALAKF